MRSLFCAFFQIIHFCASLPIFAHFFEVPQRILSPHLRHYSVHFSLLCLHRLEARKSVFTYSSGDCARSEQAKMLIFLVSKASEEDEEEKELNNADVIQY